MPKGTKVEKLYRALLDKGYSKEKAARIAQAETGLALATGEPPEKAENMEPDTILKKDDRVRDNFGDTLTVVEQRGTSVRVAEKPNDWYHITKLHRVTNMAAFENGRQKALNELAPKIKTFSVSWLAQGTRSIMGYSRVLAEDKSRAEEKAKRAAKKRLAEDKLSLTSFKVERMQNIDSRNKEWGFYGTISRKRPKSVKSQWDKAVAAIKGRFKGVTDDTARDFLDSSLGRHLADQVLDGKSVDAALGNSGFQRWLKSYSPKDYEELM